VNAILCSTCIDHCDANPKLLAATVAADLVHGAFAALHYDLPLISFICTGQEIRLTPKGTSEQDRWHAVSSVVKDIFSNFSLPTGSMIVDTDDPAVWRSLTQQVLLDQSAIDENLLDGLYHITDGSPFPGATPFTFYYEYYRYNVALYRKAVLQELFGVKEGGVLVVENVQQVKAVAIARQLNGSWPTHQLVTLPAPSRCGKERATRANGDDRFYLSDYLRGKEIADFRSVASKNYWNSIRLQHQRMCKDDINFEAVRFATDFLTDL